MIACIQNFARYFQSLLHRCDTILHSHQRVPVVLSLASGVCWHTLRYLSTQWVRSGLIVVFICFIVSNVEDFFKGHLYFFLYMNDLIILCVYIGILIMIWDADFLQFVIRIYPLFRFLKINFCFCHVPAFWSFYIVILVIN